MEVPPGIEVSYHKVRVHGIVRIVKRCPPIRSKSKQLTKLSLRNLVLLINIMG